jgi:hypothetical protein
VPREHLGGSAAGAGVRRQTRRPGRRGADLIGGHVSVRTIAGRSVWLAG